jgi:hypothetical protein
MLKTMLAALAIVAGSSLALADITVYQGSPKAGKVLGTFATKREARAFAREHKGWGESMVNNKTGRTFNQPGRGR